MIISRNTPKGMLLVILSASSVGNSELYRAAIKSVSLDLGGDLRYWLEHTMLSVCPVLVRINV